MPRATRDAATCLPRGERGGSSQAVRTIRLKPVRHDEPFCDDYCDLAAVRRYETEMRVHRAHVEGYVVSALDDCIDGAYRVSGNTVGSGDSWVVDIVDRSGIHDACSCPDFLGNDLGTCKHLEAVRRAITNVGEFRRRYRLLDERPRVPTVTVASTTMRLLPVGPWNARALGRLGLIRDARRDALEVVDGAPLVPGWQRGLRIVHAAPVAVALVRARRAIAERRRAIEQALRDGKLGLDVLNKPLFAYQNDGAAHLLAAGRALLADDMGLGKTAQAIAACELLRRRGEASRVLIVTCASLKHQWVSEIDRFAGERAVVVGGGRTGRRAALESDAPYKILNYELTWRELEQLRSLDADVVVLDEAQRARNFRTKTAATLRAIPSRFLFVLTGTPIENRLDDLYGLLQLVDPTVLGPLWKFNFDFHRQSDKGRIVGYTNLAALRERTAPVVLRRRKEAVLAQLPALTEQTRYTPLTGAQKELESDHRAAAAQLMAMAERRPLSKPEQDRLMMHLLKARQACNAVELCDPKSRVKASPKLDEFEALISEILAQGTSKVLVFSEWVKMLELAARRLDRLSVRHAMLHGGIPSDRRPALLERFRTSPDVRVLLSTDAGGVGLNLQVASYVIHLDLPWNPARLDQRTGRAHRLGQTRGVTATCLCAEAGIERGIEQVLGMKRGIRAAALDSTSEVEELEAPSFNVTLKQIRAVLEELETIGETAVAVEQTKATVSDVQKVNPAGFGTAASEAVGEAPARVPVPDGAPLPPTSAPLRIVRRGADHARKRLSLARVVLAAGFPGDAVRAAYGALAASIAGLFDEAPADEHGALVAAIYRDLLPAGRLPAAAHAVLATLHDLSAIDAHGVDVDSSIAARAVDDAEFWIGRLREASSTGLDGGAAAQPVLVARRRTSRAIGGSASA